MQKLKFRLFFNFIQGSYTSSAVINCLWDFKNRRNGATKAYTVYKISNAELVGTEMTETANANLSAEEAEMYLLHHKWIIVGLHP